MSLSELKALCVDRFPGSTSRITIFSEFERLVLELTNDKVVCELLVDGSFLTEKPEPDDIDLSFSSWFSDFEKLDAALRAKWFAKLNGGKNYSPVLDTYVNFRFLPSDPRKAPISTTIGQKNGALDGMTT